MLWLIVLGTICVTWIIAWLIYIHRKVGKPLSKTIKVLMIATIVCWLLVIVANILYRFV